MVLIIDSFSLHIMLSNWFFSSSRHSILAGAVLLLGLAASCTYSNGNDPTNPVVAPTCDASPQAVTYAGVISPIFDKNCRECHATNKAATMGGGVDFGSHQSIARYPEIPLLGSIEHSPGYDPMPKGRARISDCDILRIKAWITAGKLNN